jgi:hypothetical protein
MKSELELRSTSLSQSNLNVANNTSNANNNISTSNLNNVNTSSNNVNINANSPANALNASSMNVNNENSNTYTNIVLLSAQRKGTVHDLAQVLIEDCQKVSVPFLKSNLVSSFGKLSKETFFN